LKPAEPVHLAIAAVAPKADPNWAAQGLAVIDPQAQFPALVEPLNSQVSPSRPGSSASPVPAQAPGQRSAPAEFLPPERAQLPLAA
jgi:hypothetical protein